MIGRDLAVARARALGLVAELYAGGLTAESLGAWRQVPAVAARLPDRLDPDAAGAGWVRVCHTELHPYASVFLGAEGLLGGEAATEARERRRRAGLADPVEHEPDHLAEELRVLAWLAGAEADARRDGVDPARLLPLQREGLDALLRWLPPLVAGVEGLGLGGADALYATSAGLALDLVVAWRASLGNFTPWALPAAPDPWTDPETGLAALSRFLTVPAWSGGWWSGGALHRIGRTLDLPAGFGRRAEVLEGLLRSAAHYGEVPALTTALQAEVDRWVARYAPLPDAVGGPWRERATRTRAALDRLRTGLG